MGKRVSYIAALSFLMLLTASFVFWGCSNSNPASNSTASDRSVIEGGPFDYQEDLDDGGYITNDDKDYGDEYPPEWPEIEASKFADTSLVRKLRFDESRSSYSVSASGVYDRQGGVLSASLNGNFVNFCVVPSAVSSEESFSMTAQKGINSDGDELHLFSFDPEGLEFNSYPILEFQDRAYDGSVPTPTYTIYYYSTGTWIKYGSRRGNSTGIVKFYIPHFSTYAVLKTGINDAKIKADNSFN